MVLTRATHSHNEEIPHSAHRATHIHNEEVQPTPGIGEIFFEAISHPLEQHLKHEDEGEHSVGVLQQRLHSGLLFQVAILKGLQEGRRMPIALGPDPLETASPAHHLRRIALVAGMAELSFLL